MSSLTRRFLSGFEDQKVHQTTCVLVTKQAACCSRPQACAHPYFPCESFSSESTQTHTLPTAQEPRTIAPRRPHPISPQHQILPHRQNPKIVPILKIDLPQNAQLPPRKNRARADFFPHPHRPRIMSHGPPGQRPTCHRSRATALLRPSPRPRPALPLILFP